MFVGVKFIKIIVKKFTMGSLKGGNQMSKCKAVLDSKKVTSIKAVKKEQQK